jgi:hypothetical protein
MSCHHQDGRVSSPVLIYIDLVSTYSHIYFHFLCNIKQHIQSIPDRSHHKILSPKYHNSISLSRVHFQQIKFLLTRECEVPIKYTTKASNPNYHNSIPLAKTHFPQLKFLLIQESEVPINQNQNNLNLFPSPYFILLPLFPHAYVIVSTTVSQLTHLALSPSKPSAPTKDPKEMRPQLSKVRPPV